MSSKQKYLSSITLSSFKSIQNVNVNLRDGLNILIGKNAVGKSNFLSCLNRSIQLDLDDVFNYSALIHFENFEKMNTLSISKITSLPDDNSIKFKSELELKVNSKKITLEKLKEKKDFEFPESVFIGHGVPQKYPFLNESISFQIDGNNKFPPLGKFIVEDSISPLVHYFALHISFGIYVRFYGNNNTEPKDSNSLRGIIIESIKNYEIIEKYLRRYTPINGFRLSQAFSISQNGEEFQVSNLFFEFEIGGLWYNFNDLSDGTKRLFHIISNIVISKESGVSKKIFLIEEPELGIHPHQYFKLLQFLKQESKNFQILITTHSPQSLNILNDDELNRIVLVENKENKTVLRHLTEEEQEKAKEYKKDNMYLSDYWLYSDLEN